MPKADLASYFTDFHRPRQDTSISAGMFQCGTRSSKASLDRSTVSTCRVKCLLTWSWKMKHLIDSPWLPIPCFRRATIGWLGRLVSCSSPQRGCVARLDRDADAGVEETGWNPAAPMSRERSGVLGGPYTQIPRHKWTRFRAPR